MKHLRLNSLRVLLFILLTCTTQHAIAQTPSGGSEHHLTNIRQLTFGGDNAEAYFSPDGEYLVFQSNNKDWGLECDQIFVMHVDSAANNPHYKPRMVSTGKGRTTCSYFMPDGKHILYASTHEADEACPPTPEPRADHKYLWSVYPTFDVYIADLNGKITRKLTDSPGYDAEATVSPDGKMIVFTSDRSGDLELWTMNIDGTGLRQVTTGLGYDGGAFFSPDSKHLIFRSSRPRTDSAKQEYLDLLKQGLVAPTEMELYTCDVDGKNLRQITTLGKANWAPYFHPSGKKVLFSSNHASPRGYDFQLYMINDDGTGLERITSESIFNAFVMFSPNGKRVAFSSNRNNKGTRDTNVFVADWKE